MNLSGMLHPQSWPEAAVTIVLVIAGGLLLQQVIDAIVNVTRRR